jgi:hypothetical protein
MCRITITDEDRAALCDVDKYVQMWKLVATWETVCLPAASLGMPAQIRLILAMSGRPYPDSLLFQVFFLQLQYCITTHCFVGVVSFLVSKLRFMMKFLYFFSTSVYMFLLRFVWTFQVQRGLVGWRLKLTACFRFMLMSHMCTFLYIFLGSHRGKRNQDYGSPTYVSGALSRVLKVHNVYSKAEKCWNV